MPVVSVDDFCYRYDGSFRLINPAETISCPLPINVTTRESLSRDRGRYERSFYDVPDFQIVQSTAATIRNCRVLRSRNEWGDDFYAIVTPDDRLLESSGIHYLPEHATLMRRGEVTRSIGQATWITTHSTRNHYMWLFSHLTRVLLAEKLGLKNQILFPVKDLLSPVKLSMLDRLHYQEPLFVESTDEVIHVEELTLLEIDSFDPWALTTLRERLVGDTLVSRRTRLYISREKCHYRKLRNEQQVWEELKKLGFEKVFLEDLSLDQQISKLHSAEIVVGAHGAGFANILFCQPGTHVVEIQDPDDPNPHFYALAALLGLDYSIILGQVDTEEDPHFRDISLPLDEIEKTVVAGVKK